MTRVSDFLEEHKAAIGQWITGTEQGRIDLKILPYLRDIEDGFFVEAGALDGLFMSNTKLLEDLGWHGILIEPSFRAVEQCVRNRMSAIEHCALVSKDFEGDWAYGDFFFDGEDGLGAWSGIHRNLYGLKSVAKVPAKTLDSVLKKHHVKKVDFLSLDVEGYELEVLKGVDLSTMDISYILIEINLKDYTLEDMDEYLARFGYRNTGCLSGFVEGMPGWDGFHNDYLYAK